MNQNETLPVPPPTLAEYQAALAAVKHHQRHLDYYLKITRRYIYAQESERVKQRDEDSRRYHLENPGV